MTTHHYARIYDPQDMQLARQLAIEQLTPVTVVLEEVYPGAEVTIYINQELGWAIAFEGESVFFQAIDTRGYPEILAVSAAG